MQEMWVWSLGWEDPLEGGMATHSSVLPWRIPWTGELGGLQPLGLPRVSHSWAAERSRACILSRTRRGTSGCVQSSHLLAFFWRVTGSGAFLVSNDLDISEEYWAGLFKKCPSVGTVRFFFLMLDLGYGFGGGSPQVKGPSHFVVSR